MLLLRREKLTSRLLPKDEEDFTCMTIIEFMGLLKDDALFKEDLDLGNGCTVVGLCVGEFVGERAGLHGDGIAEKVEKVVENEEFLFIDFDFVFNVCDGVVEIDGRRVTKVDELCSRLCKDTKVTQCDTHAGHPLFKRPEMCCGVLVEEEKLCGFVARFEVGGDLEEAGPVACSVDETIEGRCVEIVRDTMRKTKHECVSMVDVVDAQNEFKDFDLFVFIDGEGTNGLFDDLKVCL